MWLFASFQSGAGEAQTVSLGRQCDLRAQPLLSPLHLFPVLYCIPDKVYLHDFSAPSVVYPEHTAYNWVRDGGYFATELRGFLHTAMMLLDCSTGVFATIDLPPDSTATIYKYGVAKQSHPVYVTDANLTKIISRGTTKTGTDGLATFAVPKGQQFRFLVQDDDGTQTYTDVLSVPHNSQLGVNATIKMFANNSPALLPWRENFSDESNLEKFPNWHFAL